MSCQTLRVTTKHPRGKLFMSEESCRTLEGYTDIPMRVTEAALAHKCTCICTVPQYFCLYQNVYELP